MEFNAVLFDSHDKKSVRSFLRFPSTLYQKQNLMQDTATEAAVLSGKHLLSHYFTVYPFLAYDSAHNVAARCMLTVYPDRTCAYIGFFECIDNADTARCIFDAAEKLAKSLGCDTVIGPVDASFWIRYRLKTNCFDQPPYTGEPYNLPYYETFFRENGYSVNGEYNSNRYGTVPQQFLNRKNVRRLQDFTENGYSICPLEKENFEKSMHEIYRMIITLYFDFQTFSYITEDEFCKMFAAMEHVADYRMVKIAYQNGKAVGFFVTLPNYGNASCGKLTLSKIRKICKVKKDPHDYILLYLGAEPEHPGLGKALSESVLRDLCDKQAVSVGALIRKGKVTGNYFSQLIENRYTYALYEKALA
ncbi:MAG: hypothetical protein IKI45_00985 [Oscillospiraceae bacterium]|nr:hypothetical protein [Oscillospiraceae bacterium]